jgi:hypothetical protein
MPLLCPRLRLVSLCPLLCPCPLLTVHCVRCCACVLGDTITLEELDLLSQVPNYVPVCAGKEWGFDDLLEKVRAHSRYGCVMRAAHVCTGCAGVLTLPVVSLGVRAWVV